MQVDKVSNTNFGIRPQLKVQEKDLKLFNQIADKFDRINSKLDNNIPKKIRQNTVYTIEKNDDYLEFRQGGYAEHTIFFDNKSAQKLLATPVNYISKTLAKAAAILAENDKLYAKANVLTNATEKSKLSELTSECEDDIWDVFSKHIDKATEKELRKNPFIEDANIDV